MSRKPPHFGQREPAADDTTSAGRFGQGGITGDRIDPWADLIADGRGEFPAELPTPDRDRLLAAVRHRLRDRLVRHIARTLAAGLRRDGTPATEHDHRD